MQTRLGFGRTSGSQFWIWSGLWSLVTISAKMPVSRSSMTLIFNTGRDLWLINSLILLMLPRWLAPLSQLDSQWINLCGVGRKMVTILSDLPTMPWLLRNLVLALVVQTLMRRFGGKYGNIGCLTKSKLSFGESPRKFCHAKLTSVGRVFLWTICAPYATLVLNLWNIYSWIVLLLRWPSSLPIWALITLWRCTSTIGYWDG